MQTLQKSKLLAFILPLLETHSLQSCAYVFKHDVQYIQ